MEMFKSIPVFRFFLHLFAVWYCSLLFSVCVCFLLWIVLSILWFFFLMFSSLIALFQFIMVVFSCSSLQLQFLHVYMLIVSAIILSLPSIFIMSQPLSLHLFRPFEISRCFPNHLSFARIYFILLFHLLHLFTS